MGRRWPPGDPSYVTPEMPEIEAYLDTVFARMGNEDGVVMLDTAAAYGFSEERLGQYLRARPDRHAKAFIATKWGEEFDVVTGTSTICGG